MKYRYIIISILALAVSFSGSLKQSHAATAPDDLPILDYAKIKDYSSDELYEYHKALFAIFAELESFQADESLHKQKSAFLLKLIEESVAQTETDPPYTLGNNCLIGGYWGNFISTKTKSMTCDSPNRCKTSSGGSGHICNPTFFTYQNPSSGTPFCAPMTRDLTTTGCLPQFEKMYQSMCGDSKDSCPKFAEHFKASVKKATGKSDPKTMRNYVAKILEEYKRIEQYCFDSKGNIKPHIIGQKESCFRLKAQYARLIEVYNKTRSTDFSCIDNGLTNAGISYQKPSAQVALLTLRAKEITDTVAPHRWFGIRIRGTDAIKGAIMSLSAVGVCENTPLAPANKAKVDELLGQFKMPDITAGSYSNLFAASPSVIKDQGLLGPSFSNREKNWKQHAGAMANCQRKTMNKSEQVKLCKALHKACGIGNDLCSSRDSGGGNDGGGHATNGGGTTSSSGGGEVGQGNNAESDGGGGHGTGPQ